MDKENAKQGIGAESQYIEFKEGIFGFEEEKKFLPVMLEDGSDAVLYLQSVVNPELSFIIMNPFMLDEEYNPVLSEEDYRKLGTADEKELSYYVFCVIANEAKESTVNLKCPIVIHPGTREARQVIMETEAYGMRHSLAEFASREEASTC